MAELAYTTDLMLLRLGGSEVFGRPGYRVIRTPANPTFHWGNFLLFDRAPEPADAEAWPRLFEREFRDLPEVRNTTLGWVPDAPGSVAGFLEAGFKLDLGRVLAAEAAVRPPRFLDSLEVRPLVTPEEWEAATLLQISSRDPVFGEESYSRFKRRQMSGFRRLAELGAGHWYGGFWGDRLVGDLGLFTGGGTGRFQAVETHPDFRGRGVCATLVYAAASRAFEAGARTLVIVAEPGSAAQRVYEAAGFRPTAHQHGLSRAFS